MKRTRQQAGAYAKAVGDAFEVWFDAQNALAKSRGMLAHIHHNEPKTRMHKGVLFYDKKSVADWSGTLERVGNADIAQSLAAETKSTFQINFPYSEVDTLQAAHLDCVARAGGLSLLVVEFRRPTVKRFAVPWLKVSWQVLRTARTVTAEALEAAGWLIPEDGCYLAKFHPGGPSSSPQSFKRYARE